MSGGQLHSDFPRTPAVLSAFLIAAIVRVGAAHEGFGKRDDPTKYKCRSLTAANHLAHGGGDVIKLSHCVSKISHLYRERGIGYGEQIVPRLWRAGCILCGNDTCRGRRAKYPDPDRPDRR